MAKKLSAAVQLGRRGERRQLGTEPHNSDRNKPGRQLKLAGQGAAVSGPTSMIPSPLNVRGADAKKVIDRDLTTTPSTGIASRGLQASRMVRGA